MVNNSNFTIEIKDDTELGMAVVLVDIDEAPGIDATSEVVGVVGTLNEAEQVIGDDYLARVTGCNDTQKDAPSQYRVQARGRGGEYFDLLTWSSERCYAECM